MSRLDFVFGDKYKQLPDEVKHLCGQVSAPPRLIAHLVLVHDAACQLVEKIEQGFPEAAFDAEAVLFGAAIHDLGKAIDLDELSHPGKKHEFHGMELLESLGIPKDRARFAYTHGNWEAWEPIHLEDLLVSLADNCWKGKRVDGLEARTVELLSVASGRERWSCFADLDEILESLTRGADERLEWHSSFGVDRE